MRTFSIYRLLQRIFSHYRSAYLLMFATVAVCTMVISGSLIIGNSVNQSLAAISQSSIGNVKTILRANSSWLSKSSVKTAAAKNNAQIGLAINTVAYIASSEGRNSQKINLYGVDSDFFRCFSGTESHGLNLQKREIALNSHLAASLGIKTGETIALRYFQASELPGDAPLSLSKSAIKTVTLQVAQILSGHEGGDFALNVSQQLPFNAFLNFDFLAELMNRPQRGNLIVSSGHGNLNDLIKPHLSPQDYGLRLEHRQDRLFLTSEAVFMSDYIETVFAATASDVRRYSGYFVNSISAESKVVPYSFAAGIEEENDIDSNNLTESITDWIIINSWTAEQLKADVGDKIRMTFYIPQPFGELSEESSDFILEKILPMEQSLQYADFAPVFPGMNAAESCSEWDPDLPVNTDRIRDQDEEYWKHYKSLPKALIALKTARQLWVNRFGSLTMLSTTFFPEFENRFLGALTPEKMGFEHLAIHDLKKTAAANSLDFSGLFIGLGFFVIIAALMLLILLFDMHLENRFKELGIMTAIGFSPGLLKRMLYYEALIICLVGAPTGAALGLIYATAQIYFLSTTWHGALNFSGLQLFVLPGSIVFSIAASIATCFLSVYLRIRKLLRLDLNELISGSPAGYTPPAVSMWPASLLLLVVTAAAFIVPGDDAVLKSAMFFTAGFALLFFLTQLSFSRLASASWSNRPPAIEVMAARNCIRRFDRSKALVRVMACALFLVVGISANHRGEIKNQWERNSGTGGFSIYAETAIALSGNLSQPETRQNLKLEAISEKTHFVQMPVIEGSEASCLNLNSVSKPAIVGIRAEDFKDRFAFSWQLDDQAFWTALDKEDDENVIPAIADADVIMWSLGLKPGSRLEIQSSDGRIFQLKFVAGLNNSIFQGKVIVSLQNFYRLWPQAAGSRIILADSERVSLKNDKTILARALDRYGLELETAAQRLNRFNTVQNTYLSMFLTMGTMALLLGCGAMAIIIRRNLLDRRSELEFLSAIGFSHEQLQKLVFREHLILFAIGSMAGLLAACVAVYPVVASSQGQIPAMSIAIMVVIIFLIAVLSIRLTLKQFFKSFAI